MSGSGAIPSMAPSHGTVARARSVDGEEWCDNFTCTGLPSKPVFGSTGEEVHRRGKVWIRVPDAVYNVIKGNNTFPCWVHSLAVNSPASLVLETQHMPAMRIVRDWHVRTRILAQRPTDKRQEKQRDIIYLCYADLPSEIWVKVMRFLWLSLETAEERRVRLS